MTPSLYLAKSVGQASSQIQSWPSAFPSSVTARFKRSVLVRPGQLVSMR